MTERASPNIVMVSLLAGLAGAGIALLLAPRSGKETRQQIQDNAEDLKRKAEEGVTHAKSSLQQGLDKTRESLTEALSKTGRKAKDEFESFRESAEHQSKQSPVLRAWEEEV